MSSLPRTIPEHCTHPYDVTAKFLCESGVVQWGKWCPLCETRTSQALARAGGLSPEEQAAAPVVDLVERRMAQQAEWDLRRAEREAAEPRVYTRLRDDPVYQEYFRSSQWGTLKLLVHARAGGKCEACRERPSYDAHHLNYDHLYEEFLFELVAVCRDCHDRWHEIADRRAAR